MRAWTGTVVTVDHGLSTAAAAEAARLLGRLDRARLDALADGVARSRFLAGRSALRTAAAGFLGVDQADVVVAADCPECGRSHGAPVVHAPAGCFVSLTHAAGRAIAVAAPRPIGVDAEPRTADAVGAAALREVIGGRGRDPLLDWVRIEAVLKADGRGLRVDPSRVRLGRGVARIAGEDGGRGYSLRSIDVDGCLASVAIAR